MLGLEAALLAEGSEGIGQRGQIADFGQQIGRVNGLRQQLKIVSPVAKGFQQVASCGLSGEEKNFTAGAMLLDLNGEIDAGEAWHHNVRDEQVGGIDAGGLQGSHRIGE